MKPTQTEPLTRFLNETETAQILDVSVQKLRNDRSTGKGLPYHKIGRSVRYSTSDLYNFTAACRVEPERI